MKAFILILGLLWIALFCGLSPVDLSYSHDYGIKSVGMSQGGVRTWLEWSGNCLVGGNISSDTSGWFQISPVPKRPAGDNSLLYDINPKVFTLYLDLRKYGSGDSIALGNCRFEYQVSPDSSWGFWNGDSSNQFLSVNASNSTLYSLWVFQSPKTNANLVSLVVPLRVVSGGYLRFIFTKNPTVQDTTRVNWKLWGGN